MKIKLVIMVSLLGGLLSLTGCSTVDSVKTTRGQGQAVTYPADFKTTWTAVPVAIKAAGLELVEADEATRTLTAKSGMGMLSYGERVAIFVEPAGEKSTRVEVVSKRVLATTVLAKDWTTTVFDELGKILTPTR